MLVHPRARRFAACIGLSLLAGIASAEEARPANEWRIGAFAHDPWSPVKAGAFDLHAEFLADIPGIRHAGPLMPRLHAGATLSLARRASHAFAGLAWTLDLTPAIFVEAAIGGAAVRQAAARPERGTMGCTLQFRESATLGYRLTPVWSVMAGIEHLSNGGLCSKNRGLTNLGLMLGTRF